MKLSQRSALFICGWSLLVLVARIEAGSEEGVSTEIGRPDIIGPTSVTVEKGGTLTLICHGDGPLQWSYPDFKLDDRFEIKTSRNSTPRPYSSTLTLVNITHKDVGFFYCSYEKETDFSNGDEVYITVDSKSDDELLVPWPEPLLYATVTIGRRYTVPCRPTNYNVIIQLQKDHENVTLDQNNYDPRFGYTIDPVVSYSAGLYTCRGRRGHVEQSMSLYLEAMMAPQAGSTLRLPKINASDDGAVTLGETFTLDCETEEPTYVFYSLNWTAPAAVINSGRAKIELVPIKISNKKAFYSRLTVQDARKEDAGEYVCIVKSQHDYRNISKIVKVYEQEDRFLEVTTASQNIYVIKGDDATWVMNISSYPSTIDYSWVDKNGKEIEKSKKYKIDKKNSIVVLKIMDVSLEDTGKYQFRVTIPEFKELYKALDLNLTVLAKPEVSIRANEHGDYLQAEQSYKIHCKAEGFPLPKIQWYFYTTKLFDSQLPRQCGDKDRGMKLINSIESTKSSQLVISSITFTPEAHGILICRANNSRGFTCQQRAVKVVDFPGENGFGIVAPKEYIEQDFVQLTCALSKLNGTKTVEWKKRQGNELTSLETSSGIVLNETQSRWSWQKIVTIEKINKTHAGEYVCLVGGGDYQLLNESLQVKVKEMIRPKIIETNLNQTTVTFKEGEPPEIKLFCHATGTPNPTIEWTKDGVSPKDWPEDIQYNISDNGDVLLFPYIRTQASGRYACVANNRNGTDTTFIDIDIEGGGLGAIYIAIFVIAVIIIIFLMLCLAKKVHNDMMIQKYLNDVRIKEFVEGAVGDINPQLGIEDQANLLPYDRKWEFPRDRLRLGMQLGSGAFGRVMKAEAYGIIPGESSTTVAVKMVKANADESHIKALMSELKIMVHLGQHVNVVNLLGACTEYLVKKKELFVIVEYCKYGSLLSYMHRHRNTFINQLDHARGIIDTSIYHTNNRTSQLSQTPKLNYAALTFTDTGNNRKTASNGYRTLEELNEAPPSPLRSPTGITFDNGFGNAQYQSQLHPIDSRRPSSAATDYYGHGSNVESMCTDMSYVSNSPTACGTYGRRRSSGSGSSWAEHHYKGDYQQVEVRPIKTTDLLCWAFQMARGMEYLASRKVLHGDLAARNVLLAENNVVKICDFGLAKEMYKDYKYKKKSEGVLLPVKWMAIESIYYGVFSTQSDVWSFGVVLWELFTLGKTPYPGMEADDRFYKQLSDGYRMEKPPLAPSSMYDLMLECWANEPSERPTFSALVDRIGDLMEEGLRQHYLDLNVAYDKMNREYMAGKQDYLSVMGSPEFQSESCRPTPERQYENVPSNLDDSGYLEPRPAPILLPPHSTDYQNISNTNEPRGHLLANNNGYVFMNHPSISEESLQDPTMKITTDQLSTTDNVRISNDTLDKLHTKVDIPAENLRDGVKALENTVSPEPYSISISEQDHNLANGSSRNKNGRREVPGISNINYIPSNLLFSRGLNGEVNHGEVNHDSKNDKNIKIEDCEVNPVGNGNANSNARQLGGTSRRQKNDSGLGSIDSSHFVEGSNRSPVDLLRRESDGSENDSEKAENNMQDYGCQHNLSYVTHSPFEVLPENGISNNTRSHPSLISGGGLVV